MFVPLEVERVFYVSACLCSAVSVRFNIEVRRCNVRVRRVWEVRSSQCAVSCMLH